MRRLFNILPFVCVVCIILALLAVTFPNRPTEVNSTSRVLIANTPLPYPPPQPTAEISPTASQVISTPDLVVASPTPFPTASTPFPPGARLLVADTIGNQLTIWSASVADPGQRRITATLPGEINGYTIAISPHTSKIAVIATSSLADVLNGNLLTYNESKEQFVQLASQIALGRYRSYPYWSKDDRYIAILRQNSREIPYVQTLSIVDIDSGNETVILKTEISDAKMEESNTIYPLGWSKDSRYVYFQKGSYGIVELWRQDITLGISEKINTISSVGIPRCYDISSEEQYLLCLSLNNDLSEYSLIIVPTNGQENIEVSQSINAQQFSDPIWSPDGTEVAIGFFDTRENRTLLRMFNINTRVSKDIVLNDKDNIRKQQMLSPVSWSSDGAWIVVESQESTPQHYLISVNGIDEKVVTLPRGGTIVGWVTDSSQK